jgi:hypothetical protein
MKRYLIISILFLFFGGCSDSSGEKELDSSNPNSSSAEIQVFKRVNEPNENAFSILIPNDWEIEGGLFRLDPSALGGPANSIAAKLDFTVRNPEGTVIIRWLPDMVYFDMTNSPAGQMGMFPEGSQYQGMTVYPKMSASIFIEYIALPYANPDLRNYETTEKKSLGRVADNYERRVQQAMPNMTFSYDAAIITINYEKDGRRIKQKIFTIVEDWGSMGAGMWGNKESIKISAPADEFAKYESLFSVIQGSVKINQKWLVDEIRGQMTRSQIAIDTQQEVERIGVEIAEHRAKTNAEIHNDMFLTLTEQEEFVNPYTNEVEVGSNQWKHRWINESGDVIYTDDESYDPNVDINLKRSDFKRTPVRKRIPE